MKTTKAAYTILCALIIIVSVNTFFVCRTVSSFEKSVSALDVNDTENLATACEQIYDKFGKAEIFLGITVSHNDLTNAEELFSELIGAAYTKNQEEVIIAKSRLIDALLHLRRLVGFNIESVL